MVRTIIQIRKDLVKLNADLVQSTKILGPDNRVTKRLVERIREDERLIFKLARRKLLTLSDKRKKKLRAALLTFKRRLTRKIKSRGKPERLF